MTDSLNANATLNSENLEEHTTQTVPQETPQTDNLEPADTENNKAVAYEPKSSKAEIIERLKELAQDIESATKSELDFLKQNFYKLHKAETDAAQKAFVENGGSENDFIPAPDPDEEAYKDIMKTIKEKRNELFAQQEHEKEDNLQKKLAIIEKIKELIESPEDANKNYNTFKQLQQEWNEIKLLPANKVNELWKSYQVQVEKFYDILKLNNEFRDYDFKKNLEIKTHLCEAAERLANEPDVVSAFHQLQKLHQEFRDTGPVAKDLRESVWARFKAASTVVNRRHQQHFERLKAEEQHNLDQKTVICEIVEATEYDQLKTFLDWENKTKEVLALQAKWKTIGFAPQKMNVKIFERFRSACDEFFKRKGEYYKKLKEELSKNLERKKALCEQAEALKDSTDWKSTSETLTRLQKEWKAIGPVQKKYSDTVWKRFISACDYFFDQKKKATSSQHSAEIDNLNKKKALIERLNALLEAPHDEDTEKAVRDAIKEWNNTGHVPFKDKDRLYKEFHRLVDKLFDGLNLTAAQRRLANLKSNSKDQGGKEGNALQRERDRLIRQYEIKKNEIQTYENNLGFLTSSSKKGNSLVSEITRKVDKLKADLELLEQQIRLIEESM